MPPLNIDTALDWRGRTVVDRDGDKIGTFDELYLDESDRPAWAAVTTGLFGMRQTFVPLSEARSDGDVLRVPFGKDLVKDAPRIDPDAQLDAEEEAALYRHYGLRGDVDDVDADRESARDETLRDETLRDETPRDETPRDEAPEPVDTEPRGERAVARDEADAAGDGDDAGAEMIRSEEEVEVGTRRRVAGKARLKKYVVTEHVQKVVPVKREKVALEFDPPEGEEETAPERGAQPER